MIKLVLFLQGALGLSLLAHLPEENFILRTFEGGYLWQGLAALCLYVMAVSSWELICDLVRALSRDSDNDSDSGTASVTASDNVAASDNDSATATVPAPTKA